MNNLEVVAETLNGVVFHCELRKQYQLAYKNLIVFLPTLEEYNKLNMFFQNAKPNCCRRHSPLRKKYVFRINDAQAFFAFDSEEINELKKLLSDACFKIQIQELLNHN